MSILSRKFFPEGGCDRRVGLRPKGRGQSFCLQALGKLTQIGKHKVRPHFALGEHFRGGFPAHHQNGGNRCPCCHSNVCLQPVANYGNFLWLASCLGEHIVQGVGGGFSEKLALHPGGGLDKRCHRTAVWDKAPFHWAV